jgi:hypothetical protein
VLRFQGVMTPAERASLDALSGTVPAAVQAAYLKAVGDLFDLPRTFFKDHMAGLFAVPATAAADLLGRPSLDAELRPVMLDSTGMAVPRDASGNLPAAPAVVQTENERKFRILLEAVVPRTRSVLKKALAMQSAVDAFGLDTKLAAVLLDNPAVLPSLHDPSQPALADLLDVQGDGLGAAYFANATLTGDAALLRTDAMVEFDWTAITPDPVIPLGDFSVRWAGLILAGRSEEYSFEIECGDGARLWVGGKLVIDDWKDQPSSMRTGAIKLTAGTFYSLRLEYYKRTVSTIVRLSWNSPSIASKVISVDSLFTAQAATLLTKLALVAGGLHLNAKETEYFCTTKLLEFTKLPRNGAAPYDPAPFRQWLRLVDYAALRDAIPRGETDLIDVFTSPTPEEARRRLAAATGWWPSEIEQLTGADGFAFTPADFTRELRLRRLPGCFSLMRRLGITASRALQWAQIRFQDTSVVPAITYWAFTLTDAPRTIQLAQDVRNIARAKHDDKSWAEVAKPLSDAIRDPRKAALVGYILAMPSIIERNVTDSGRLFEFFLVDVETTSCAETSRIKQAISSVQLFIHRCLMGLEDQGPGVPYTVRAAQLDEPRWRWMQRYVIWEANRKVFLYPENWIEPELRDDRTPFFRELESELLQSDLTEPYVEKALLHYLERLDDVARLEICGVREDTEAFALHWFGRTRNTPHQYFHRMLTRKRGASWDSGTWTAWEKMPLDIGGVEDGERGELSGVHLLPVLWHRRLYAFWPTFQKKPATALNASLPQGFPPIEQWEIKLSSSEFFQGKWSPREHSEAANIGLPDNWVDEKHWHWREHYQPTETTIKYTTKTSIGPIKVDEQSYTLPSVEPRTISGGELDGVHLEKLPDFAEVDIDDTVFEMDQFLPPPARHLFGIASRGDQLIIDTYQRYTGTAVGKLSRKRVVDTVVVQSGKRDVRQRRKQSESPSTHATTDYRRIGRFTIDGCRNKVQSTSGHDHYSYNSLIRPKGTTNFFNWIQADASTTRFELDPSPVILNRIPSRYTVVDSDPEPDFADFTPFCFQDSQRVYLVVPVSPRSHYKVADSQVTLKRPYALLVTEQDMRVNPWTPNPPPNMAAGNMVMSGTMSLGGLGSPIVAGALNGPAASVLQDYRYQFLTHWHPHVCELIRRLNRDGILALLATDSQWLSNDSFSTMTGEKLRFRTEYAPTSAVALPLPHEDMDFGNGAYSLYNWELFFHAPLLIAERLSKNQRFADAQSWFHYIFNPLDNSTEAVPAKFWKFRPFKWTQPERILDMMEVLGYQGSDPATLQRKHDVENQIDEWAHDPFNPHRIARLRPGAYMKNVVMRYLDNLLAWGDQLFRQDTLESINEATHLYVLASALLGPKPQRIPTKNAETRRTFAQLRPTLDAFSNAHVAAETLFPFATSDVPAVSSGGAVGAVTTLFFCIPPNDKLLGYWDLIEDRLFKIRHCMNIAGVVRQLPLFEPPVDPALLVQAAAKGVDLNSVLNDLYTPLPRYRFEYMLQKALEMCVEVRAFGNALLAALEKRDAESLALLRTTHEKAFLDLIRNVKVEQLNEAEASQDALRKARETAAVRFSHYQGLLGYKADADFAPGASAPIVSDRAGDNRLPEEIHQQERLQSANEKQGHASIWDTLSSATHYAMPDFSMGTSGTSTTYGGSNIGAGLTAMSHFFGHDAANATYEGNNAAIEAAFRRRDQTWVLESNVAAKDIVQIDKQIAAAGIHAALAQRDLDAHDKQIEQNEEMREFLQERKFTQEELYFWMQNELSTLHLQAYQIAYEWAKQAQRCYRFTLGTDTTFIQFGSWDSLRKGLLGGERLYLQLKQMERSYLEQNRREYELTKHVSLPMTDPVALIKLRQTGSCEVSLPEASFDLDFPGHYMRRLKSVALTIPCVVGPYTGVNCTLTLLRSEMRAKALVSGGYRRKDEEDSRFIVDVVPAQSIAASQAQNDTGTFEVNFRDERYLPFEGAGAVSTWRIELQNELRQFDYDTISDVVLHLRYTAREGGALLKHAATKALTDALKDATDQPLMRLFSLRHEYSTAWYRFLEASPAGAADQFLTASLAKERFPFAFQAKKISIDTISLFVKVRPEHAATHNQATLKFTMEPGSVSTPGGTPLTLEPWNGLLRAEIAPAGAVGDWTLTAWLSAGGAAHTRLAPGALEDIALVCTCTCA